jgi:hypothetical protein
LSALKLTWTALENAAHKDYRAEYGNFTCSIDPKPSGTWKLVIFKRTDESPHGKIVAEGFFYDPATAKRAAKEFLQKWLRKEARWRIVSMMRSELAYTEVSYEDSGAVYGYTSEQWQDVMAEMERVLDRLEDYAHK